MRSVLVVLVGAGLAWGQPEAVYRAGCAACHGEVLPRGLGLSEAEEARHAGWDVAGLRPWLAAERAARLEAPAPVLEATLPQERDRGARPPLPPRWVFLPWKWKNVHEGWEDVLDDVAAMSEHDVPCGAYIVDSPWATGYGTHRFAEHFARGEDVPGRRLVEDLHAAGVRVLLWTTPIVNDGTDSSPLWDAEAEAALHAEGERNGWFAEVPAWQVTLGSGYEGARIRWWKGIGSHIEVREPEGVRWWYRLMDRALVDLEVDGFKVDGGWPPLTADYYFQTAAHVARRTGGNGVTISRPCGGNLSSAGACWTGDEENDWEGLRLAARRIAWASAEGYSTVGSDIGGFGGTPSPELLVRWAQLGCFSGVMELGGGGNHEPWTFPAPTLERYRYWAVLRSELVPYLYHWAHVAQRTGVPLMRWSAQERYAFRCGEELFVVPMVEPGTERVTELPAGRWRRLFAPERVDRGRVRVEVGLDEAAVWVREGALLPLEVTRDLTGLGRASDWPALTLATWLPAEGVVETASEYRWGQDPEAAPTTFELRVGEGLRFAVGGRALAAPRLVLRVWGRRVGAGLIARYADGSEGPVEVEWDEARSVSWVSVATWRGAARLLVVE